jgi:hypothetical protein
LVSSALALDAPFWIYMHNSRKSITNGIEAAYKLSNMPNILVRAFQQTILKPWYHLKELLKNSVFPTFPDTQGGLYHQLKRKG